MNSKNTNARGLPNWLLLLGCITAVGPISVDLYLPGFAMIEHTFRTSGVELTLASYLAGISLGQVFYGPITDRFGRKSPLYVGLLLYTAATIGCALAGSMGALIFWRFIQSLGACAGMVIARAIVRDRCEPEEAARAFSTLMLIVALAPVLAPLAGGWIVAASGWRATFWVQGLCALVVLIAIHYILVETHDASQAVPLRVGRALSDYGALLRDRQFVGHAFMAAALMAALFCYIAGAPTVLMRLYSISPQRFGWLMALNGAALMASSRLNIYSLRRSTPGRIVARVVWLPTALGIVLVLVSWSGTPPLALVLCVQAGFVTSIGLINPNVGALAMAKHGRNAGTASALLGSIQSMGTTSGGLAIGFFNNGTLLPLAWLMAGCAVAMLALHAWVKAPVA